MNWKLFIARRIYKNNDGNKEVSKPAVRIAMAGISIGLAVMIVSVAVVIGFKNQVRDKVVGLASEVIVTSLDDAQLYMTAPVAAGDSLLDAITKKPYVSHVQRYSDCPPGKFARASGKQISPQGKCTAQATNNRIENDEENCGYWRGDFGYYLPKRPTARCRTGRLDFQCVGFTEPAGDSGHFHKRSGKRPCG